MALRTSGTAGYEDWTYSLHGVLNGRLGQRNQDRNRRARAWSLDPPEEEPLPHEVFTLGDIASDERPVYTISIRASEPELEHRATSSKDGGARKQQ